MKAPIKIAIVDDHTLLRQGLAALLRNSDEVIVTAELASGEEAINLPIGEWPDVYLMDIIMPGMSGIETLRWLKGQGSAAKIILISSEVNKEFISNGIRAGACGYLNKGCDRDTLLEAIVAVNRGQSYFSQEVKALIFHDFLLSEKNGKGIRTKRISSLSRREEEVLRQIASGKTLSQIADEMFLSVKTVESHKLHIKDKLGIGNTAQLVLYAIEQGLVVVDRHTPKSGNASTPQNFQDNLK